MTTHNVPIISVQRLNDPSTQDLLDSACRTWGFFQITDHGIDTALIEHFQTQMLAFFNQSSLDKRALSRTADNPWGFYDQELTKNTKDWKEIFDYGPPINSDNELNSFAVPRWPEALPDFKPTVLNFYKACEKLALNLIAAISSNLGMPPTYLPDLFGQNHTSFLRLNYYPICPALQHPGSDASAPSEYLGVNHHTDAGALTILLQDQQPGLEVFNHKQWHPVKPLENALVVNIGDIVQVWSNDLYRAPLHRVKASNSAVRFSAPFFLNPPYLMNYAPLPTRISDTTPARYRPINWGEFRSQRAAGDYSDDGEEIQISRYAIRPE